MPRPPKLRWSKSEGCWRTDAGGKPQRWWLPKSESAKAHEEFAAYIRELGQKEAPGAVLVWDVCREFLQAERDIEAVTKEAHVWRLDQFLQADPDGKGLVSDRPASSVGPELLTLCVAGWKKRGLSAISIRGVVSSVKACWAWAASAEGGRIIPSHTIRDFKPPKAPRSRPRRASRDDVAKVLRALRRRRPDMVDIVRFLSWTGARPGEATNATWADVDTTAGTITLWKWKNSKKTGRPRVIQLTGPWLRILSRRRGEPGDRVFPRGDGKPWLPRYLTVKYCAVRDELGLPKIRLYDLRHESISRSLERGGNPKIVADLHGTSVAMVDAVYGHITQGVLAAEARRLSRRDRP
jgi:integrase